MTRIKISLLPAELKRQSSMMRMWTIIALILAIIAMIMLAGNLIFNYWLNSNLLPELESLKTENQNMTENIGRLSYIQEMFDEIENNNAIIEALKGNDPQWDYLINEMAADLTLYGLNMSRMRIAAGGDMPGCQLTGTTTNAGNLEMWLDNISEIEGIESVRLGQITTDSSGDELIFHFDAWVTIAKWNRE